MPPPDLFGMFHQSCLAGDYHAEIENDVFDYCITSSLVFEEKSLRKAQKTRQPSTFYTCCVEEYPNGQQFINSL